MEIPNGWMPSDHEQDAAIANAVHRANELHGYELEDPIDLSFDILRELHRMGYYIKSCGAEYKTPAPADNQ